MGFEPMNTGFADAPCPLASGTYVNSDTLAITLMRSAKSTSFAGLGYPLTGCMKNMERVPELLYGCEQSPRRLKFGVPMARPK
jgi:hypothetical protein